MASLLPAHLEGVAEALAAGEFELRLVDALQRGKVGRAEPLGLPMLAHRRFDGEDLNGTGDLRALDDGETDAAAAYDSHRRTRLHPGGVERGRQRWGFRSRAGMHALGTTTAGRCP